MSVEGGGSPGVLEAVPQALAVAPQEAIEDAAEDAVDGQLLDVGTLPHALRDAAHVGAHDVDHLTHSPSMHHTAPSTPSQHALPTCEY